jgi:hypothetical protein
MTLEQDCLGILAKQMGPAARIFLKRQCQRHLNKEPTELKKSDLDELAKWCYNATQQTIGTPIAENIRKNILELK